jgi:enoyl-CoA hydratase
VGTHRRQEIGSTLLDGDADGADAVIRRSRQDGVAVITLNRPGKRNALTVEVCHELRGAIAAELTAGARALVLTGAGTVFCSGADLDEVYTAEFLDALYAMLHAVADAPVPVIAAVNGPAIGAGTQLAIAADLRVAAPGAVFGVPTAKIGLAVDPWTIRRLAALAGSGAARELLLACAQLDAAAALRCGLAQRSGEPADAVAWARELTALAPLTVAYSKRVLNELAAGTGDESRWNAAFAACWASADLVEGRQARAERRPPRFRGS